MTRPMVLVCWGALLLGSLIVVAAAQPQEIDGGPRGVALLPVAIRVASLPTPEPTMAEVTPAATLTPGPAVTPVVVATATQPPAPPSVARRADAPGEWSPPAPTARVWTFGDGWTGPGFDDVISVTNPGDHDAWLRVVYLRPDMPALVRHVVVPARGRRQIAVHGEADGVGRNGGLGWSVTIRVESVTTADLTVERSVVLRYRDRPNAP